MERLNLIYKYQPCTPLSLNSLRNGELFFASPKELNDSTDSIPRYSFKGSSDLWRRLSQFVLLHAFFELQKKPELEMISPQDIYDLSDNVGFYLKRKLGKKSLDLASFEQSFIEALLPSSSSVKHKSICNSKEFIEATKKSINLNVVEYLRSQYKYTCSFSRSPNNPTMWGHYADSCKGFVVVFDVPRWIIEVRSPKYIFPNTKKVADRAYTLGMSRKGSLKIFDMTYKKSPCSTNGFFYLINKFFYSSQETRYDVPALIQSEADKKQEHLIGLTKYLDWKYEKEVRCFFPKDDFISGRFIPSSQRVLKYHPRHVRGVIFGPKMSRKDRFDVIASLDSMRTSASAEVGISANDLPQLTLFKSQYQDDEFSLKITPICDMEKTRDFTFEVKDMIPFSESSKLALKEVGTNMNKSDFDNTTYPCFEEVD